MKRLFEFVISKSNTQAVKTMNDNKNIFDNILICEFIYLTMLFEQSPERFPLIKRKELLENSLSSNFTEQIFSLAEVQINNKSCYIYILVRTRMLLVRCLLNHLRL